MKTDQEKLIQQERKSAVLSLQRMESNARCQLMLQVLLKWKAIQEFQVVKTKFEESQRDKTKYYEREMMLLKERSSNAEKEASEKMKSVSYDYKQFINESGVHRLSHLLQEEKGFKQLVVFMMWKEKALLSSFQKSAQMEKDSLSAEIETVGKREKNEC